jgi:hypothetical protein
MSNINSSGPLARFRVVIKRGAHPTNSLTLRCVDVQAADKAHALGMFAEEARQGLNVTATLVPPMQAAIVAQEPAS